MTVLSAMAYVILDAFSQLVPHLYDIELYIGASYPKVDMHFKHSDSDIYSGAPNEKV